MQPGPSLQVGCAGDLGLPSRLPPRLSSEGPGACIGGGLCTMAAMVAAPIIP